MESIYSNGMYVVCPAPNGFGYHVINVATKVVEAEPKTLPSAINQADIFRDLMEEQIQRCS